MEAEGEQEAVLELRPPEWRGIRLLYIGRYMGHPPMAMSRLTHYDGTTVRFGNFSASSDIYYLGLVNRNVIGSVDSRVG